MKIFFAAGGTAGHINPAIAVAQALCERDRHTECLFAAVPGGMEEQLVSDVGFSTTPIHIKGLKKSLSFDALKRLFMVPRAVKEAKRALKTFQPNVVFATGGYLSYPVVKAAHRCGIPCILHESNAIPGLAIRKLAKYAKITLLNYPGAARHLPAGVPIAHVGNPLRLDFEKVNRPYARRKLGILDGETLILSFGGSLGAETINRACMDAMKHIFMERHDCKWIHACGERNYKTCRAQLSEKGIHTSNIVLRSYIDDMAPCMAAADIVIARAGAITITELSTMSRASILIPFPGAANDHQTKNAEEISSAGGCILFPDAKASGETLTEHIKYLLDHPVQKKRLESRIKTFQPHNCMDRIISFIEKYQK